MQKHATPTVRQALQKAFAFQQSNQLPSAIAECKTVLAADPGNVDALYLLSLCLYRSGRAGDALHSLNAALGIRKDVALLFNFRGVVLRALGRRHDSLSDFDSALALRPDYGDAHYNKGNTLRDLGRLGEARDCYERAARLEPQRIEFINNLAGTLSELNQNERAVGYYEQLAKLSPRDPAVHANRALALSRLGRFAEALTSYDLAIEINPLNAEGYSGRGDCLRELGRLEEALASCENAVRLDPGLPQAHCSLANVLKELKRPDQALPSYDRAISLKPDYAEAHCNRGGALNDMGRVDEAIASYEKAIGLKPEAQAAWLGLAGMELELGRFADAEAKFQKARELDPGSVTPLCGLAEVKKFRDGDPLIAEFRERLSGGTLRDEDRSRLHHAYAKICNDLGHHDEAMEHFSLGKRLLAPRFDIGQHREAYAALKQVFTREFFAHRKHFGVPDERPVFVVGMPRSGTTLTEQMLASHHAVCGMGELLDMPKIGRSLGRGLRDPQQFSRAVANLTPDDVRRMAGTYLEAYRGHDPRCLRFIDKMPHNYEWLGLIALMFPNARIIHCRRNPLDTCVSIYMQRYIDNHDYAKDLHTLGAYYRAYEGLMMHWREVLPVPIHDSVYEETIADLEAAVRPMLSFLNLDWDPACLNYAQKSGQVKTASSWQVRQPIFQTSVGRWRHYEKHLGPLKDGLGISEAAAADR